MVFGRKTVPTKNDEDGRENPTSHRTSLTFSYALGSDPEPSRPVSTAPTQYNQITHTQNFDDIYEHRYSAALPQIPEESSINSDPRTHRSTDSASTIVETWQAEKKWSEDEQYEEEYQEPPRLLSGYDPSYQPVQQYLPDINTGEPLDIGEWGLPTSTNTEFPDAQPLLTYNYQEGVPPTPHVQQSFQPTPHQQYAYPEPQYYENAEYPTPNHFAHDPEAYASGIESGVAYRPPRSRSPSPFDEEDYHIVGNESLYNVHYTGTAYSHAPTNYSEKDYRSSYASAPTEELEPPGTPTTMSSQPSLLQTQHFGPAPMGRVHRRHKKKKRVGLTNGNLVVELPVPPKIVLPLGGSAGEDGEMTKMRYTAVTCDPNDFEKCGFTLRQNNSGRSTELVIMVTMFNEDEILFCRTMYGVMRNIAHLCERKNSQTWGADSWKKVVVIIIADGRKKIHPRVLDCLTILGVYQPGDHMKNMVNDKHVTAHLFEYTTGFGLDPDLTFRYPDGKRRIVPTQIIFCLKEKNERKINSHRWGFNAFSPLLQPNVCVLLDVGTRPGNTSIYKLWKAFDRDSSCAGACGEIAVYKGPKWRELLNPLVAAQNFEYKTSAMLDKTTEGLFGYISVLPGAFSAYRYIALQNNKAGFGPLNSYFKGEVLHGRDTDIFTSNMYLAEDRILCFELVAKAQSAWTLKYVKGAIGETDVPDALPEFISQRRRWLNGSFFAATYAIAHTGQILRSGHSATRKFMLLIETLYTICSLTASWFSIGNFYLFFIILTSSVEASQFGVPSIKYFNAVVQYIMASLIITVFLMSMGNKPQASKFKYKFVAVTLAALMAYMFLCSIACAVLAASEGGTTNQIMLLSVIVTYGVYAFSSILAMDPWHLFTSFLPYLLLSPTYTNILNVYAFSNLDDISWGTKQDAIPEADLGIVVQNAQSQVDLEMHTSAADVNDMYDEALGNLKRLRNGEQPVSAAPKKKSRSQTLAEKEQAAKNYYANVRTNVLLTWVLSNGILLVAILGGSDTAGVFNDTQSRTKSYMTFILAFSAITNGVRFGASTLYLMKRVLTGS